MSNTPTDDHTDQDAEAVERRDLAQPEHQRDRKRTASDDTPSATDLDEREANRSSHRKAAGPDGRRGAGRATRGTPSPSSSPSNGTGDQPDDAPAEPHEQRSRETRLEP